MAISILKQFRQVLGLTQMQVAKAIGVSQPTYQNYESGNLPIPDGKVNRLARALKVTPAEVKGIVRSKERAEIQKSQFPSSQYWGEVVVHFDRGEPLILSIDFEEYRNLFRRLQEKESQFLTIESSYTNQMISVRRAAIADVYLADDGSSTYGPEHERYDVGPFGVYRSDEFWEIADLLLAEESPREELDGRFGKEAVTDVAQSIGLDMPHDIDRLIEEGNVKREDREKVLKQAEESADRARQLTRQITWQFSNGVVRRQDCDYDSEFLRYWWIRDEADPTDQGGMIIVDADDAQTAFINPDALDYISIPLHKFEEAQREQENNEFGEEDEEDEEDMDDDEDSDTKIADDAPQKAAKRGKPGKVGGSGRRR